MTDFDDDPDDFERGLYGPGMVDWQPEPLPPPPCGLGDDCPHCFWCDSPVEVCRIHQQGVVT